MRFYLKQPHEFLAENNLRKEQAMYDVQQKYKGLDFLSGLTGFAGTALSGFANSQSPQSMAYGGQNGMMPLEVEGGETATMPNGQVMQFQGKSHEQGGIQTMLPQGAIIDSKKIKVVGKDGKTRTMADIVAMNAKKESMLMKKMQNNFSDAISKNTYDRTKMGIDYENEKNRKIQEMVREELGKEANPMQAMYGFDPSGDKKKKSAPLFNFNQNSLFPTSKGHIPFKPFLEDLSLSHKGISSDQYSNKKALGIFGDPAPNPQRRGSAQIPLNPIPDLGTPGNLQPQKASFWDRIKNIDLTGLKNFANKTADYATNNTGNIVGGIGDYISATAPLKTTLQNRAGDTINPNFYKNYGEEGLETNERAQGLSRGILDNNLADLQLSYSKAIRGGRNSARGVNTQRALDLGAYQNLENQRSQLYNNYTNQQLQLLQQRSGLQNQRDQLVAAGADKANILNRQDRDNFFTNLGIDRGGIGTSLQNFGKRLNDQKTVKEILDNLEGIKLNAKETAEYKQVIESFMGLSALNKQNALRKAGIDPGKDISTLTKKQLRAIEKIMYGK